MILSALCEYYDILSQDNESDIPKLGYCKANVDYGIILDEAGKVVNVLDLRQSDGPKNKLFPKRLTVPLQQVRSGKNPSPYFLCDKSEYLFNDSKFEQFKKYNLEILNNVDNLCANSIKNFLNDRQNWNLEPKEGNFVFMTGKNDYMHNDAQIKQAWEDFSKTDEGITAQCLITGKNANVARLHPKIKGVKNAQSSGANIVSFNKDSFTSYGKQQSYNAPVSEEAAFKYGTTLNYLLKNINQKMTLGDSTVVFWAKHPSSLYGEIFKTAVDPNVKSDIDEDEKLIIEQRNRLVKDVLGALNKCKNLTIEDEELDMGKDFYVLALVSNNARISVRFFYKNTFGNFIKKINRHYKDMEIVAQKCEQIPLWLIMGETVHKSAEPKGALAGKVFSSILNGTMYPSDLLTSVVGRARTERNINWVKASIIKAYLIRKYTFTNNKLKEDLTVGLNEDLKEPPYLLGRLFAILERIQFLAQGKLNSGIRERFFASAATEPSRIFPQIIKNAQKHLSDLKFPGKLDEKITQILSGIERFPIKLNLEEQGLFMLGYYHQKEDV